MEGGCLRPWVSSRLSYCRRRCRRCRVSALFGLNMIGPFFCFCVQVAGAPELLLGPGPPPRGDCFDHTLPLRRCPGSAVVVLLLLLLCCCWFPVLFLQLKAAMTAYVQSRGLYIVHDKVSCLTRTRPRVPGAFLWSWGGCNVMHAVHVGE